RCEVDIFVNVVGDDQHRIQTQGLQLGHGQLGLGRFEVERLASSDAAFAGQLRRSRPDARAIHLLVDLLAEVFFRRVGERATTPTPQRRRGHTGARAAGTLLAPGLLGAVLDFGAVFLGAVATACVGLVGHDDLVNQRFVEVATEDGVRRAESSGLTLVVQELEIHVAYAPFLAGALMAGRTTTSPPAWPGTAPLTNSRPRSASTRTMSRF